MYTSSGTSDSRPLPKAVAAEVSQRGLQGIGCVSHGANEVSALSKNPSHLRLMVSCVLIH